MQKLKQIFLNERIIVILVSIFIGLATLQCASVLMQPDLDISWEYALNYFFSHHIELGKDVIFTYGPLGFMMVPLPLHTYIFSVIFHVFYSCLFTYLFLILFLSSKPKCPQKLAIGFIATYVATVIVNIVNKVMIVPILLVLLRETKGKKRYFYLACVFSALALLFKTGLGLLSAFVIFSYSVYQLVKFKNLKEPLWGFLIYFSTLCAVWFAFYHNLSSLFPFLYWTKEVSLGYSQTMIFLFDKNYLVLLAALSIFLLSPFVLKDKEYKFYFLITFLFALFYFKYAIVRHTSYILEFILIYFIIFLNFASKIKKQTLIFIFAFLALAFIGLKQNLTDVASTYFKRLITPNGTYNLINEVIKYKTSQKDASELSSYTLFPSALSKQARGYIGNQTIDIYPWEQTFVYVNQLNWKPRFMMHSYMDNTPALDEKNAIFFQSKEAPEFVLWHKQLWDFDGEYSRKGVFSIDRKYLFNDDPQTLYQILNTYGNTKDFGNVLILKKSQKPILPIKQIKPAKDIKFNEWIEVPQKQNGITLLGIKPERTFAGNILKLLGTDVFTYIDYKFNDGSIARYKLSPIDNMEYGIWITPHVYNLQTPVIARNVKEARITIDNPFAVKKNIQANWIFIPINNPAFALKFDFSKDLALADFKQNIKQFHCEKLTIKKEENSSSATTNKQFILQPDKKYFINIKLISKTKIITYPKIAALKATIQDNYNDTVLVFNNGEEQEFNFEFETAKQQPFKKALFENQKEKMDVNISEVNLCTKN